MSGHLVEAALPSEGSSGRSEPQQFQRDGKPRPLFLRVGCRIGSLEAILGPLLVSVCRLNGQFNTPPSISSLPVMKKLCRINEPVRESQIRAVPRVSVCEYLRTGHFQSLFMGGDYHGFYQEPPAR
jgi:hypothetical protein